MEVYEGEMFGFIGRNGIGKSTTIDCMIGSKKYNSGRILLDGFDIKKDPLLAKESFGYVASEPTCYEEMSGRDYLEFVANIYKLSEGDFKKRYLAVVNGSMDLEAKFAEDINPIIFVIVGGCVVLAVLLIVIIIILIMKVIFLQKSLMIQMKERLFL